METTEVKNRECPVFKFSMSLTEPHFNADSLRTFNIPNTLYSYVLRTEDWEGYEGLVCWVLPESLVDVSLPQFSWLEKDKKFDKLGFKSKEPTHALVKAKKLRGIISYGLLVKVDDTYKEGEDASEHLGIIHWSPAEETGGGATGGDVESPPPGIFTKYDCENGFGKEGRRVFVEGEPVYCSCKIHGANGMYTFTNSRMYARSRTEFKREFSSPPDITIEKLIERGVDPEKAAAIYESKVTNHKAERNSLWWKVLSPEVEKFCRDNPDWRVYGEVYGQVQSGFNYGLPKGVSKFAAFDIMKPDGTFLDPEDFIKTCDDNKIDRVPTVAIGIPFNVEEMKRLSDGMSLMPGATNIREGIVVKPMKERRLHSFGRVFVKFISPTYSEK